MDIFNWAAIAAFVLICGSLVWREVRRAKAAVARSQKSGETGEPGNRYDLFD